MDYTDIKEIVIDGKIVLVGKDENGVLVEVPKKVSTSESIFSTTLTTYIKASQNSPLTEYDALQIIRLISYEPGTRFTLMVGVECHYNFMGVNYYFASSGFSSLKELVQDLCDRMYPFL